MFSAVSDVKPSGKSKRMLVMNHTNIKMIEEIFGKLWWVQYTLKFTSAKYIVILTNNNNIIINDMNIILIIVAIIWKLLQILSDSSENGLSTYLKKYNDIAVHI